MNTFFSRFTTWYSVLLCAVGAVRSAQAIEITHLEAANVTTSSFTVFWQTTEAATPSLSVFADPDGFAEITDSVRIEFFPLNTGDVTLPHKYADRIDRRNLQNGLKENGLFLARVSRCDPATEYYVRAGALSSGNDQAESPVGGTLPVRTAAQTSFLAESLQVMVEFPEGNADGLVATLSTPAAAFPLAWTVGDSGFSNRAFFNLSDLVDSETNTNLQPSGLLPLTIRLHRPGDAPRLDDEKSLEFTSSFVVAKVTDLIFSGSETPQLVHGFAFNPIGTQTAGVPFRVTIRALDLAGSPLTEFTGVADVAASGTLLQGAGPTPAFVDGILADHLVAIADPGQHYLEVALPGGNAASASDSFRLAGSYERWVISQFEDPENRQDPLLSGRGADPWGTGVSNLLAYAIGTDPRGPDRSRMPRPVLHHLEIAGAANLAPASSGASHLAITYAREKGAADVIFIPEVSDDLLTWHSGAAFTEEVEALDHGHYELVTARDLAPLDGDGSRFMRLRVRSTETFATWQARHFPGDRFYDARWSSATAAPAGDGVQNLTKYALGLDPNTYGREDLPQSSIQTMGGERYLIINYTRPKGLPDLDYIIEASTDLITWYSGSEYIQTIFTIDLGDSEQIFARDRTPLNDESRFIRLRVARR